MTERTLSEVAVPTVAVTATGAHMIRIHATTTTGATAVTVTGLVGDSAATTRDRVRAAVVNAGFRWPTQPVTLHVFPTPLPAPDAGVDAALAVALLVVTGQAPASVPTDTVLVGELGLDGRLRTPRSLADRLTVASGAGFARALVPADGRQVAASVPGVTVWGAHHLRELVDVLRVAADDTAVWPTPGVPVRDLADVPAAYRQGRRLLEIAAAGGHRLALVGPATTAMLAQRLPGLLPDLDEQTGAQVADLHRAAGLVPEPVTVLRRPPWQAPHHSTTVAGLVGSPRRPGAVSLAHAGVLFLDDAAAFDTRAIEWLRQPLDTGRVLLRRGSTAVDYPARPLLVVAARPCPCSEVRCDCTPVRRTRYRRRLAPLFDRVAIRAALPPVPTSGPGGEDTATVAARVAQARQAAAARWAGRHPTNARVPRADLIGPLGRAVGRVLAPLNAALDTGGLTDRGGVQVLRLAFTLADLDGRPLPDAGDITEALTLHQGDHHARHH